MAFLIGIAGGSASGKTSLAHAIQAALPKGTATILSEDRYYHDLRHLPLSARRRVNFDHPRSLDLAAMARDLRALRRGRAIEAPEYDFTRHVRHRRTTRVAPSAIVIAEGLHVFLSPTMRALFDLRLFVTADDDVRLMRRIARDVAERGRALEFVLRQYAATVQPAYARHVAPMIRHAHVIVDSTACGPDFAPLVKGLRALLSR